MTRKRKPVRPRFVNHDSPFVPTAAIVNAFKTHCYMGHEFTPENTYWRGGPENGTRACRQCNKEHQKRWRDRAKQAKITAE